MLNDPQELCFGPWLARRDTGELLGAGHSERLEPKVMELLFLLAGGPGQVWTREEIMQQLWPGLVVGEDTLARAVFKLRKALGDDAKAPRYIQTLPKRGYRFMPVAAAAPAEAGVATQPEPAERPPPTGRSIAVRILLPTLLSMLVLGGAVIWWKRPQAPLIEATPQNGALLDRANDYYFQYRRVDNEAAIELFERVIAMRPTDAPAYAGLANALVQRVIRWPHSGTAEFTRLGDALAQGHTRTEQARQQLQRAMHLAEQAVQLAPRDPAALKALGFVRSAREDFAGALEAYSQAVDLDPDAWGPLINIGDILEINGQPEQALPYLERAFAAMSRVYTRESARIQPWHAELGLNIARRHLQQQRNREAEQWYRSTLEIAPLHAQASADLAALLRSSGRAAEAEELCLRLRNRVGTTTPCDQQAASGLP